MARKKKSSGPPQVLRKIYFYRADAGVDESGTPNPFEICPFLEHFEGLPFSAGGRYWTDAEGNATCCWIDRVDDAPQKMRLVTVRRSGLPQLEDGGSITPLSIPASSGLAEQIHVLFLPGGIVGSEFNFYGPRMSRLSSYLRVKAKDVGPNVVFSPLLRHDVMQDLNRLSDVRLFHLKVRSSYADVIEQADEDLGRAFQANRRIGHFDDIEIALRSRKRSRRETVDHDGWGTRLLNAARTLLGREDVREEASIFKIKGLNEEAHRVEEFDLLRDQFIVQKRIVRADQRSRALDSDSAYAAIQEAYDELRDELTTAAEVRG